MKVGIVLKIRQWLGLDPKFKMDESVKAPYKLEAPLVTEDGILIEHKRINIDRLSFQTYQNRMIEFTKRPHVLDLYGATHDQVPQPEDR